eukprot:TRINITY_DN5233_c0_g1_i1.p2 TRINITY_DN5233_c0_g1~~TRINITY_DN5233_c0_g1_i1.p2  ORF type:complete len:171 (+),score=38.40 TRINITY_DN5233_c0_g1_i1:407-919(+)
MNEVADTDGKMNLDMPIEEQHVPSDNLTEEVPDVQEDMIIDPPASTSNIGATSQQDHDEALLDDDLQPAPPTVQLRPTVSFMIFPLQDYAPSRDSPIRQRMPPSLKVAPSSPLISFASLDDGRKAPTSRRKTSQQRLPPNKLLLSPRSRILSTSSMIEPRNLSPPIPYNL